jgi:gustatory receptor
MRRGFSIYHFEALIFFILATIRGLIFFRLAIRWKKIITKWKECEEPFVSAPYGVRGWSLSKRIRIIFGLMAFLGAGEYFEFELILKVLDEICLVVSVEHYLWLANSIHENYLQITYCNPRSTVFWDNFLARTKPHLRYWFGYSPFLLPFYEVS